MKRQNKLTILGISLFSAIILGGINTSQYVKADITSNTGNQPSTENTSSFSTDEDETKGTHAIESKVTNSPSNSSNEEASQTKKVASTIQTPINKSEPQIKTVNPPASARIAPEETGNNSVDSQSTTKPALTSNDTAETQKDVTTEPTTGTVGTSTWTLGTDGILHVGAGTLPASSISNQASPWKDSEDVSGNKIKQITLDGPVIADANSQALFAHLDGLTTVNNLNNLDTNNVTDMNYLFAEDPNLSLLDLTKFNTKNVQYMFAMFADDYNLSHITGLDKWDTENLIESAGMFLNHEQQPGKIDDTTIAELSGWDVSKDLHMSGMFQSQGAITKIDFAKWNFAPNVDVINAFRNDSSLSTLKLNNLVFDYTNNENNSTNIFASDGSLNDLVAKYKPTEGTDPLSLELSGSSILYNQDAKITVLTSDGTPSKDESPEVEAQDGGIFPILKNELDFTTEDGTVVAKVIASGLKNDFIYPSDYLPKGYLLVPNSDHFFDGVTKITIFVEKDPNYKPTNNKPSHSKNNSSHSDTDVRYNNQEQNIASYPNKSVNIYDDSGSLTGKTLLNNDWISDETMTLNGTNYYHLSGNQWIKNNDAYEYFTNKSFVLTFVGDNKQLIHVDGTPVSRELRPSTDWVTDRYTDIDGTKYFRVATNEWVSGNEVIEYVPNKTIVSTSNTAQLYDETGNLVNDRELGSNTSWQSDRYATINGLKMYRVATNEWVPASVVSVE